MKYQFLNLHDVISIISIVEAFFLCAFFWLIPGKQRPARRILAILFLLVAGTLLSTLFIWNSYLQTLEIANSTIAPVVISICVLLQGPVLYLYLESLSRSSNLWHRSKAIHLLPAFASVAVILAFNITVKEWLPSHWHGAIMSASTPFAVQFVWAMTRCLPTIYIVICFRAEHRLRRDMKQTHSNISRMELMVADIVLGGFFLLWLWLCIGFLIGNYLSVEANDLIGAAGDYFTAILVNTLCIFGLTNTRQLLDVVSEKENIKPAESELSQEKIDIIEHCIHVRKLYLESNINLERFAEQVGLKPRDVSNIINSHYQSNFFEFINGFRIEEAKRLLMARDSQDSVLDIAYKSGFNSQSAFQRFFKRIVGVPPSEFRNREKAIQHR